MNVFRIRSTLRAMMMTVLLLLLAACSSADREKVFETLASPTGRYTLTVTVIDPLFPQGPHQVAVYVKDTQSGENNRVAISELAYDGVPFTTKNIGSRWISERNALICLRGTDRPDKGIRVMLKDKPVAEIRTGC